MTEIMRMLPKDLQREVWAFIGMESLGISPTAECIKELLFSMYFDYKIILKIGYDTNIDRINYDYTDSIFYYMNAESISRMYLHYRTLLNGNKDLFNGYRHIHTERYVLTEWLNEPQCEFCDYPLTLRQFKNVLNDVYLCGINCCDNCYGINTGIIKDEDEVVEWCNNCDKMLVGWEWKHIMNKTSEFAGMCGRCIEIHEVGDSESEEEFSSEEEEEDSEEED
jgi:hypothetical protein